MIRSFCSADQLRRRSTVEIISDDMCLTVLKHVNKDSMIHLIPPRSARRQCHSPERTLTQTSRPEYLHRANVQCGLGWEEPHATARSPSAPALPTAWKRQSRFRLDARGF